MWNLAVNSGHEQNAEFRALEAAIRKDGGVSDKTVPGEEVEVRLHADGRL